MQPSRQRPAVALVLALFFSLAGLPLQAAESDYAERVAEEHADDAPSANVEAGEDGVRAGTRAYATLDGNPVTGYLARPDEGQGPFPAVLLIHEWWGLNDNIRAMARRFAEAGYVALAVDLYEGRTAKDAKGARKLMQNAMQQTDRLERNLEQAFFYLDIMPSTGRIGSVGWCFGGGWSLRTAMLFPEELEAAVIYYGQLVTDPQRLQPLQVPLLGHFGEADPVVPVDSAREFDRVLTELEKPHEVHIYPGAAHAFANPSGDSYQPRTAAKAWSRTLAFLGRHLEAGGAATQ